MRNVKAIAAVLCVGLFGACATDPSDTDEEFVVQAAERKVKIDPPTNMPTWLAMSTTTTISNCTWSAAQNKCNCKYETKRC
jgi:hypothetical protein